MRNLAMAVLDIVVQRDFPRTLSSLLSNNKASDLHATV